MKRNFSAVFLSLLLVMLVLMLITLTDCSSGITEPEAKNDLKNLSKSQQNIVTSSFQFGCNLFKEIVEEEDSGNIIISPLSVSTAFGMALNGAAGQTYDEIKSVLELDGDSQDEINEAYRSLNELLTQADPEVIFESANSIWYRHDFTFEQSFLDVNKNYFDAEVQGLDFSDPSSVDVINNWVSQKTKEKITSILKYIPPAAVMYIINAIYFKGTWKYQFAPTSTIQDDFYVDSGNQVQVMMMSQKSDFSYKDTEDFQAIELPYGDGNYGMIIILPKSSGDINSIINQMDTNFWNNLLDGMDQAEVNLWLPRFEIEYKIKLNDVLQALGMRAAFGGAADFSAMRKPKDVFISEVLHKTYMKVDEEGTEAAAVTSIEVSRLSIDGDKEIYMKVNHSFIFSIIERNSGTILFIGKIVDPS